MGNIIRKLAFAGLLCFSALYFAQAADPVQVMLKEGKNHNLTMEHLDAFCNTFGGRLTGSDAYENALEWAAWQLKSWGLEVEIQEVGSLPVGFNRGPWFGKMLDAEGMDLHFVTPSFTRGTRGVQRGRVLKEPKTRAQFENMKGALKGAWVLISGTSKGWPVDYSADGDSRRARIIAENEAISISNAEIMKYNQAHPDQPKPLQALKEEPALFYKEMVDAGILGIIQSAPVPLTALYDRKNLHRMDFNHLPPVPDIKLDERQYALIAEKVDRRDYFLLEFDIRNHFKMGPVKYHNLIAYVKGTRKPRELVIGGGHLDAYDVATGGVDCGTGIAPTLEAARLVGKAIRETGKRPERTLVFAFWAAEEYGLYGSKYFVEQIRKDKRIEVINYFNRDAGPLVSDAVTVPESWYRNMVKVCTPLYDADRRFPFTVKKGPAIPRPKEAMGADRGSFAAAGYPAFIFGTSDALGYNFSYMEIWHTERDTYDKSFPEYMEHSALVKAVVMWGMGDAGLEFPKEDVYIK